VDSELVDFNDIPTMAYEAFMSKRYQLVGGGAVGEVKSNLAGLGYSSAPMSLPLNCPAGGQAISLVRGHMTARGHFGRRGRARQAIWTPPREPGLW
jgi:hypothetical protein